MKKSTWKIVAYKALCDLEVFNINGKEADYSDFGDKEDVERDNAEAYACGNMCFIPKPPKKEVLEKYGITTEEYQQICEELDCLSFGCCGWCS